MFHERDGALFPNIFWSPRINTRRSVIELRTRNTRRCKNRLGAVFQHDAPAVSRRTYTRNVTRVRATMLASVTTPACTEHGAASVPCDKSTRWATPRRRRERTSQDRFHKEITGSLISKVTSMRVLCQRRSWYKVVYKFKRVIVYGKSGLSGSKETRIGELRCD